MKDDPIMAEVRAAREALARLANYDLDRLYMILKKTEEEKEKTAPLKKTAG